MSGLSRLAAVAALLADAEAEVLLSRSKTPLPKHKAPPTKRKLLSKNVNHYRPLQKKIKSQKKKKSRKPPVLLPSAKTKEEIQEDARVAALHVKKPFKHENNSSNRMNINRARSRYGFKSKPLSGDKRTIRTLMYNIVKEFAISVLLGADDKGVERADIMKMAMNNPPTPDLLAPKACTYHSGENLGHVVLDGKLYPMRAAYQVGSQLGLDQTKHTIHQFTVDMVNLKQQLKKLVLENDKEGYYKDTDLEFNEMDMKIYYSCTGLSGKRHTKELSFHTDNTHDKALKRGSPVAICSFGDNKILKFRRAFGQGKDTGSKNAADNFFFPQESGTVVLLDPRDEEGALHAASHFWQHAAKLDCPKGISFSLMFRVIEKAVPVDPITNRLQGGNKYIWSTAHRDKAIPQAEKELAECSHYLAEKERILRSVVDTINAHKPSKWLPNKFESPTLEYKKYN
jgi:hypothetical protein